MFDKDDAQGDERGSGLKVAFGGHAWTFMCRDGVPRLTGSVGARTGHSGADENGIGPIPSRISRARVHQISISQDKLGRCAPHRAAFEDTFFLEATRRCQSPIGRASIPISRH